MSFSFHSRQHHRQLPCRLHLIFCCRDSSATAQVSTITPPADAASSQDASPKPLDSAILQLGPVVNPAGGHPAAAPPAGGPQLGGQRFGIVYTHCSQPAVPTTEAVAPKDASVVPVVPAAPAPSPAPPTTPPVAPPSAPVVRTMTHSQTGSLRTVQCYGFSASVALPIPANYRSALADPNWRAAMAEEYKALIDNGTWRLIPRPPGATLSLASGC